MSLHKYSIVLLALLALLCSCHDEDKGDIPQSDERTADFIVKYKDDFVIIRAFVSGVERTSGLWLRI